ncbi:hypothetical protein MSHO_48210 [Mycobacterium shottsii]|uniref:Uncharacterized protein n=1 Tax=Mycobacterium shottsii TaxID=133549 RepID=A0A7I7LHE3_9MYCO|nr:hypothetical protein MSHO_48210 [Mycobacterium shottsii]
MQMLADRHRPVAAHQDQRIDLVLRESAQEFFGAGHFGPATVALPHRVGGRVAPIGRADDCAALVDDPANPVAGELDQSALGIVLGQQQPIEAVSDPDHVPAAVSRGKSGRVDHRVGSRRVPANGTDRDSLYRGIHDSQV